MKISSCSDCIVKKIDCRSKNKDSSCKNFHKALEELLSFGGNPRDDTMTEFEKWWAQPKPVNWLQFPMAQKMAAKAGYDEATNKAEEKHKEEQIITFKQLQDICFNRWEQLCKSCSESECSVDTCIEWKNLN